VGDLSRCARITVARSEVRLMAPLSCEMEDHLGGIDREIGIKEQVVDVSISVGRCLIFEQICLIFEGRIDRNVSFFK
jgi:hypothetical protein